MTELLANDPSFGAVRAVANGPLPEIALSLVVIVVARIAGTVGWRVRRLVGSR